jgi:hypothetical protein
MAVSEAERSLRITVSEGKRLQIYNYNGYMYAIPQRTHVSAPSSSGVTVMYVTAMVVGQRRRQRLYSGSGVRMLTGNYLR